MKLYLKATFLMTLIISLMFLFSCRKKMLEEILNSNQDIEDLVIDPDFSWNMSTDVKVNIGIYEDEELKTGLSNIVLELKDVSTDNVVYKGNTDDQGKLETSFTMPTSSSYIMLSTTFKDTILSVVNGMVECKIATDSVIVNGTLQSKRMAYRRAASNLLTNGDFEINSYDSTGSYYDKKVDLNTWYVRKGDGKKKIYGFIAKDG